MLYSIGEVLRSQALSQLPIQLFIKNGKFYEGVQHMVAQVTRGMLVKQWEDITTVS